MFDITKYNGNELKYIKEILNGKEWSSTEGSWTNKLEKEFAKKFNAKYAVAMNSGTSTLHSALYALGVGNGDEVITTPLTVIMDSAVILQLGAIPVYADVNQDTFTIDSKDVEEKITSKTKAILVVSLYGYPSDMENLLKISKEYNIPIIEDNAQHLGKHKANITSYSFESSKHLSCGEGGIVLTNNEELARKMRLFGNHGFYNSEANDGRIKLNLNIFQDPEYKRHSIVGYNYRLSEFQSAIALAQLEKVDDILQRRRKIANEFIKCYTKKKEYLIYFNFQKEHFEHTYWTFTSIIKYGKWRKFRELFIKNGGSGIYGCWQLSYNEPAIKKIFGKKDWNCINAEYLQPRIMQFKLNMRSEQAIEKEINALEKTLEMFVND